MSAIPQITSPGDRLTLTPSPLSSRTRRAGPVDQRFGVQQIGFTARPTLALRLALHQVRSLSGLIACIGHGARNTLYGVVYDSVT